MQKISFVAIQFEIKLLEPIFPSDIAANVVVNIVIFVSETFSNLKIFFSKREGGEKSFRNGIQCNFIIYKVARNIFIVSKFLSRFYNFFFFFYALYAYLRVDLSKFYRVKAVNFSRIVIPTTRVSVLLHNAVTVRTRKSHGYEIETRAFLKKKPRMFRAAMR